MSNIYMPERAELVSIIKESEIEWLFKVKTTIKPSPGQFIQVSIPMVGEAPISVADCNHEEGWIEFLIRKVGRVTDEVFNLEPGASIFLRGAYGNPFPIDKYKGKRVIIVAGGSGTAPVRPLIKQLIADETTSVELILGFKNSDSILFKEEVKEWEKLANTIITVDKPSGIEGEKVGLVTKYIDELKFDDGYDNLEVVIVGPPMMMKFATLGFVKLGVPEEKIWVSFERNMSCAVGKCGHCKIDETYVCLEGPVFNYVKAQKLLD